MPRRKDVKKSDFTAVTSQETTDYFDFVRNGQNLKISQADMATFLGVSGTLESRGEPSAIPVLRVIANVNYIRNILGGSGISASVSPQDGIILNHNFTVDTTGTPIITDVSADSPVVRSLSAGGGITLSVVGDSIEISESAVPASTKVVVVYSISDFPTPVGGLITLAANTEYNIRNDISSANRFQMSSNTVLSGADGALIELEYTGAGTMITAVDVSMKIKELTLTATSGTMFDVSSTTGQHLFRVVNSNIACDNAGNLSGLALVYFFNTSFTDIYTQGLTFTGAFSIALFDTMGGTIAAGAGNMFTLGTATFDLFTITKGLFNLNTTGYLLSGLANSGNINVGGYGYITNSRNFGAGANPPSDNIFPSDDRWTSAHNTNLVDSYDICLATHGGATIAIASSLTPVKVTGTWTTQKAYRFTGDSTGRWTYNGAQTDVAITISVTADVAATDQISFFLYKNGVQVAASRLIYGTTLNNSGSGTLVWDDSIVTNDYFELYVQNDDSNANVNIRTAVARIRS